MTETKVGRRFDMLESIWAQAVTSGERQAYKNTRSSETAQRVRSDSFSQPNILRPDFTMDSSSRKNL